jgi:hypothetical protein
MTRVLLALLSVAVGVVVAVKAEGARLRHVLHPDRISGGTP